MVFEPLPPWGPGSWSYTPPRRPTDCKRHNTHRHTHTRASVRGAALAPSGCRGAAQRCCSCIDQLKSPATTSKPAPAPAQWAAPRSVWPFVHAAGVERRAARCMASEPEPGRERRGGLRSCTERGAVARRPGILPMLASPCMDGTPMCFAPRSQHRQLTAANFAQCLAFLLRRWTVERPTTMLECEKAKTHGLAS